MSFADDYNRHKLANGFITGEHISTMTRLFQERRGLPVDGKFGPETRRALEADSALGHHMPVLQAISWARKQRHLWAIRAAGDRDAMVLSYFADEPRRTNWCAAFVASALEAGGVKVPRNGAPRRGAQALTRWVAEHGSWRIDPDLAVTSKATGPVDWRAWKSIMPGDVICWRRGVLGWQGHVALVLRVLDDGSIEIAEGNVDGGQLVIRALAPDEWPTRLKGLYGVARPAWGGAA